MKPPIAANRRHPVTDSVDPAKIDWVGDRRSYFWGWGLPTILLIVGIFVPPPFRTALWFLALAWQGGACLINAARCKRTHCYLTGPFFVAMATVTLFHGTGWVSLGEQGWIWIGLVIVLGTAILWIVPERFFGRFL